MAAQLVRRRPRAVLQHDHGGHRLLPLGVLTADDGGVGDLGVAQQHLLDFGRDDVLAAADDHVVDPVLDVEEALLVDPPEVEGSLVLIVALIGIPVNLLAVRMIGGAERRSLNIEGAFQHLLTDLFAFVATAIAGALILATGFERADGIASLLIAAVMLWAAWGLLRDSGRVFMEAAPPGLDPALIGNSLAASEGVREVHDLHVWEVTTGMTAVSAHLIVGGDVDCHQARWRAARLLADRFGIDHSTLQVEHEHRGDELISLDPSRRAEA